MTPCITKAEVLITRRCNLKCASCGVIKHEVPEMTLAQWNRAWDVIYNKLGAGFVAIYGGEPLMMGEAWLLEIIYQLSQYRRKDRDFTIISNGCGLQRGTAERFMAMGLQSWTSSVDTISGNKRLGKPVLAKTAAGLKALRLFRELGLRDTCGIITVTAQNLDDIIPTVHQLCGEGHWVGIDLIHYQRGDGEYSFSTRKEDMPELILGPQHMEKLALVADQLLREYGELKVFPTRKVLEMWKDPKFVLDLSWKCKPGHAITIDSDGSIGLCDDRMPTEMGNLRKLQLKLNAPWNILDFARSHIDFEALWGEFLDWYYRDLAFCKGCAWSTHVLAVDALESIELREHYVHNRLPIQLDMAERHGNM